MSDTNIDGAAPKEPATPTPQPAPAPAPAVAVAKVDPAPAPAPAPQPIAAIVAKAQGGDPIAEKVKELDEALKRVNGYEQQERNKRTLAVLRGMGAIGSDATMLMLAAGTDPDSVDGRAKLDRLREIEPALFRTLAPDTRTAVDTAVNAHKAPPTYTGRYGDDYAKRIAAGVVRRANGGE